PRRVPGHHTSQPRDPHDLLTPFTPCEVRTFKGFSTPENRGSTLLNHFLLCSKAIANMSNFNPRKFRSSAPGRALNRSDTPYCGHLQNYFFTKRTPLHSSTTAMAH